MEREYGWRLEIRVTCETDVLEFAELPECTRESIMNLIRSGSTYGYFELDDGEEDNCKNGKYNCDSCGLNGDCIEQGIDGRPRWMEAEDYDGKKMAEDNPQPWI